MPSCFAHFAFAATAGYCVPEQYLPRRYLFFGMILAAAPDLDTVGYWMGVPYESMLGHRGLFHSILVASFAAAVSAWLLLYVAKWGGRPLFVLGYLLICAVSHGLLDAFTNGGLGIALLAPFSNQRFFAPITPIEVAPLDPSLLLTEWGMRVLASELFFVGLPAALACLGVAALRYARRHQAERGAADLR